MIRPHATRTSDGGAVTVRADGTRRKHGPCYWSNKVRGDRVRTAKEKGAHSDREWLALLARANDTCPRCLRPTVYGDPRTKLEKDHIVRLVDGGSEAITNIQPLCRECNRGKHRETIDWMRERGWR